MEVETLLATWQAAFSLAARHRSGCTGIYDVLLFLTSVLVLRASVPLFLRLLWCPLLLTGLCCTCCNFALLSPCLQMPKCPLSCRLYVPRLILFLHYFTLVTEPYSSLSLSGHGLSLNSVSWYGVLFLQPQPYDWICWRCFQSLWNRTNRKKRSLKLCSRSMNCRMHYFWIIFICWIDGAEVTVGLKARSPCKELNSHMKFIELLWQEV